MKSANETPALALYYDPDHLHSAFSRSLAPTPEEELNRG